MIVSQLSIIPLPQQNPKKIKTARLGRYEQIKRQLHDPYQIFVDISSKLKAINNYKFIDLLCGAGGVVVVT
jgi:hypothetical protein